MQHYTHYTDFLKDKNFILWQLAPDESLESQWMEFRKRNPDLNNEIQRAIDYLKTKGLNNATLSDAESAQLLHKIQSSIAQATTQVRQRRRRLIRLAVASCAAIALTIIGLNLRFLRNKPITPSTKQPELIVGNLLNNEAIRLITPDKSFSFDRNVQVAFDDTGNAKIIQRDSETTTVALTKSDQNTLIVPYGKRSTLTLSDGSRVWINSGSALDFPAQFAGDKREVRLLSGEMYIEVSPNSQKPFYVQTSDFTIKVYGTKFNVSAYDDSPSAVVLVSGKVGLQSANKKETFLSPDEQAVYSPDGTFSTRKVDATRIVSWKDGYLTLDKTPMTEVLKQVGRYYNLAFNYDQGMNLQKRTCTGKIHLSENLDYVMATIGLLSSTKYTKTERKIIIINETD